VRHISFPPSVASQREVITRVAPWWESIDGTVGAGPRVPIIERPATIDATADRALTRRQVSHAHPEGESRP